MNLNEELGLVESINIRLCPHSAVPVIRKCCPWSSVYFQDSKNLDKESGCNFRDNSQEFYVYIYPEESATQEVNQSRIYPNFVYKPVTKESCGFGRKVELFVSGDSQTVTPIKRFVILYPI